MTSVHCRHCGAPRTSGSPTCEFCETVFPHAVDAPPRAGDTPPGVLEAMRSGNKIEAIRRYREATKCGLKEAKEAIDALETRHRF